MNLRFYDDHRIKIVEVHLEEYVFKKTHLRVNICVHLANVNLEAFAPEFIHLILNICKKKIFSQECLLYKRLANLFDLNHLQKLFSYQASNSR